MRHLRNILVGVDLVGGDLLATSDLSIPTREAVDQAVWLARHTSAELTFFAAIDVSAHAQELLRERYEHASRNVQDLTNQALDELVKHAQQAHVTARRQAAFGTPWREIIRQVLRGKHDLVVVGTRDLNRAERILFGSTGIKLLHNCPCPVWITKPGEKREVQHVLVASDLGEVSLDALHMAVTFGQLTDTRTHLLHAVEYDFEKGLWRAYMPEDELDAFRAKRRADAERTLQDQLAQTDHRTLPYGVQVHLAEGPADDAILAAVKQYDIDLLVMGTVARSGIPGLVIGNTAERLLPQVPCSLLAVKPAGFESPVTLE